MRALKPPSGYLSLNDARDKLIACMHEGVPPSERVRQRALLMSAFFPKGRYSLRRR